MSSENISTEIFSGQTVQEPKMDEIARHFLEDLQKEQNHLKEYFPICNLLIEEAYDRFYSWGQIPGHDSFADIMKLKPMKLVQRVFVPVQEYPQLDLTKKVLNLKENMLEDIEHETRCQIFVKGRNSMGDEAKEEELRHSKNPRYLHLNKELFLEIITEATAIECHTRIAYALAEIRKYLLNEANDVISAIEATDQNSSNIEYIKIERMEEPPLDIDIKEPPLQLATPLETKTEISEQNSNPLDISLADKIIKLLDETVLNPHFKSPTTNQLEPDSVTDPININVDNETENVMPTTSAASRSKTKSVKKKTSSEKLGVKVKRIVKRRISKDAIQSKSMKMKMDKLKAIKKKNLEAATKNKKQKYPGIFYIKDAETDKILLRKFPNTSIVYEYLGNPSKNATEPLSNDIADNEYKPFSIEYLQQHPSQLVFEFTPREIILCLLENMPMYPVLWEFHKEAFNKDYSNAIESLCKLVNGKWLLNIEPMQMCRSITRIFRFYRFLYPFDCIEAFEEYFDICSSFLPATTIEIPHARCTHCFCCFERDKELRKHLTAQHKWRYKCLHCCEDFNSLQDLEFHKRLPHYLEVFICPKCNKKYTGYKGYKRHAHNMKTDLPNNYICDVCQKAFRSNAKLKLHKVYHAEKQFHCDQCPCKYFTRTALMEHLKKHSNEPRYICDICGNGHTSKKSLQEHMVKHSGEKVTCNICNLQIRKYNLYRHLRTIHVPCEGTIEETFRARSQRYKRGECSRIFNTNNEKRKRRPAERPRKYDCKVCNILFECLKDLLQHNRECHSDLMQKLPCKMCDSTVAYTASLKRHYRAIHKLEEYQIFAIVDKYMDVNAALSMTPQQALDEFAKQ